MNIRQNLKLNVAHTVAMEREYEAMQQENNRLNTIVNSIQGTVDQLLTEEFKLLVKLIFYKKIS